MSSSSSNVPQVKKGRGGRGGVPPPSIFPKVVYPGGPDSPVGIQPPVVNSIPQSFDKAISKAAVKAGRHADTKNRIIQFLAPPPSHQDPLRVMPADQLAALSDPDLVHQALQLLTTANFSGSIKLPDGSAVSIRDCILEFATNSKSREGREIKKQLNERLGELKALLDVKRFQNKQTDDGSEVSLDDDFSSIGLFEDDDEVSSSTKCKRLSTLAEVTVGTAQECQDKTKRKIKPTNRLGTNVALKGRQHLYATESRTYQKNHALLMVPASKTVPEIPVFPVDVLSAPKPGDVSQVPSQSSAYLQIKDQLSLTEQDTRIIWRLILHLPCPRRHSPVPYSMQALGIRVPLLNRKVVIMVLMEQAQGLHPMLAVLIPTTLLQFTMVFTVIYSNYYSRLYPLTPNIVSPVRILVVASARYCCQTRTNRLLSPRSILMSMTACSCPRFIIISRFNSEQVCCMFIGIHCMHSRRYWKLRNG
jgi:hypothetical protein